MAVYTVLNIKDITTILTKYNLIPLHYEGIKDGILNTNYLIFTAKGKFVLRVLEGHRSYEAEKEELDFLLELNDIIPCSLPCSTKDGKVLIEYNGKMMTLFYFIEGEKLTEINEHFLSQIGILLGKMHLFSKNKILNRKTRIDEKYYFSKIDMTKVPIAEDEKKNLLSLYKKVSMIDFSSLPCGVIHNDIFPDNILIKDGFISGIIDFNDSSYAPFIFDLGIVINYWIRIKNFSPETEKKYIEVFLTSYESIRKLSTIEKSLLDMGILKMALAFIFLRINKFSVEDNQNILIEDKTYYELLPLLKYYHI
ncbi:homoserine kinase [Fusobacterium varium]|uniref:homoserine kinase n=1 Tax=Fusobacterium varium TaxID=856 RepID=UPI000E40AA09|nr:homoserine kinase [Fusobacterium varium]MCI6033985.1 homoserine kinase [Fusobacterium varium]RGJ31328.1 homoserine kinase [Fusobacterium varium]RHG37503.1 homoserine kinase [Fusobacterium varium]